MARQVGFYLMGRCSICDTPYPTTTWEDNLYADDIKFCFNCGCRISRKLEAKSICKNCKYHDEKTNACTSAVSCQHAQYTDEDDTCTEWTEKGKG